MKKKFIILTFFSLMSLCSFAEESVNFYDSLGQEIGTLNCKDDTDESFAYFKEIAKTQSTKEVVVTAKFIEFRFDLNEGKEENILQISIHRAPEYPHEKTCSFVSTY